MPDDMEIVGGVGVTVDPVAADFWSKFQAQTQGRASAVGDQLGQAVGNAMQKAIAKGIAAGIADGAKAARAQGTKAGGEYGSAYGKAARERIDGALDGISAGVDLDIKDALAKITALEAALKDLQRQASKPIKLPTEPGGGTPSAPGRSPSSPTSPAVPPVDVPVRLDAGDFSRKLQAEVEAAAKSLPEIPLDANSSDADRKLADIREQLLTMSQLRIGIDIDEQIAIARVAELRADLERLAAESPTVRVQADAATAAAELSAVQERVDKLAAARPQVQATADTAGADAKLAATKAEADRVGATREKINVDADTSAAAAGLFSVASSATGAEAQVEGVVAAGVLLGTVLVPAAGAAAIAVAGIATAGLSAGAGVGVLLLGLAPVISAVKAMGSAQDSAGTSASTYASRQNSLASANDQVRSSETSLADAQRAAVQAQQALTTAREQARQAMQDLNLQVADGALAQRQAALDVQNAKQQLDATLANPQATLLQRQQAQLTYDQAVQQTIDLGVRQDRLVAQQQTATKAGVEGSQQVVAAKNQIQAADERVVQAEQQVAAAQRAVAQASQSLDTGVSSANKLNTAMSQLTPTGQRFALFLYGLRGQLSLLSAAAQNGFLPGLQAGITAALPLMPRLISFVTSVSDALGQFFIAAGQALTAPFWQQFFGWVQATAGPTLTVMGQGFLNLAKGAAGLLQAFGPAVTVLGQMLLGLSQRFATFGTTVGGTAVFGNLITNALTLLQVLGPIFSGLLGLIVNTFSSPQVGASLRQLLTLVQTVFGAVAPIVTTLVGAFAPLITTLAAVLLPIIRTVSGVFQATLAPVISLLAGQLRPVLIQVGSALSVGLGTILPVVGRLLVALAPVIGVIVAALAGALAPVIVTVSNVLSTLIPIVTPLITLLGTVLAGVIRLLAPLLVTVATVVGQILATALRILMPLFTALLPPILQLVGALLPALIPLVQLVGLIFQALAPILTIVVQILIAVLVPVLRLITPIIQLIALGLNVLLTGALAVFKGIAAVVLWAWNNFIHPSLLGWQQFIQQYIMPVIQRLWSGVVQPIFGLIGNYIGAWWRGVKIIFQALVTFITKDVPAGFDAAVGFIKSAWQKVQDVVKAPIKFVIQTVLDDGLIAAFNTIADKVGLTSLKIKPISLPKGFAGGGYTGPGAMYQPAGVVHAGEWVLTQKQVQAIGVDRLQAAFGGGKLPRYPGDGSQGIAVRAPGYAGGGLVGWLQGAWDTLTDPVGAIRKKVTDLFAGMPGGAWMQSLAKGTVGKLLDGLGKWISSYFTGGYSGPVTQTVAAAQQFIKQQNGKPYIWASAGPEGYDCSGFVSAVWNVLHGKNPYQHTFSTSNEAPYFPLHGHGVFTAGWANPGETGGGDVGHTAGNLAGLAFESGGALGNVHYGKGSTSVDSFAHVGHPVGFDSGGYLPPGLTVAYNATGRPEPILTSDQWDALLAGRSESTVTRNFHFHDVDRQFTLQDLQHAEYKQDLLERMGRQP